MNNDLVFSRTNASNFDAKTIKHNYINFSINLKRDPYIFDRDINASNNMMKLWCLDDQGHPRPKTFTNSNSVFDKKRQKISFIK